MLLRLIDLKDFDRCLMILKQIDAYSIHFDRSTTKITLGNFEKAYSKFTAKLPSVVRHLNRLLCLISSCNITPDYVLTNALSLS